jgi:hypothetical protein
MSVLVVEDSLLVTNLASSLLRDLEFDRVDRRVTASAPSSCCAVMSTAS